MVLNKTGNKFHYGAEDPEDAIKNGNKKHLLKLQNFRQKTSNSHIEARNAKTNQVKKTNCIARHRKLSN